MDASPWAGATAIGLRSHSGLLTQAASELAGDRAKLVNHDNSPFIPQPASILLRLVPLRRQVGLNWQPRKFGPSFSRLDGR